MMLRTRGIGIWEKTESFSKMERGSIHGFTTREWPRDGRSLRKRLIARTRRLPYIMQRRRRSLSGGLFGSRCTPGTPAMESRALPTRRLRRRLNISMPSTPVRLTTGCSTRTRRYPKTKNNQQCWHHTATFSLVKRNHF